MARNRSPGLDWVFDMKQNDQSGSGSNSVRLRPLCFAAYRAESARATSALKSGDLFPRNPATPKLAVTVMVLSPKVNFLVSNFLRIHASPPSCVLSANCAWDVHPV